MRRGEIGIIAGMAALVIVVMGYRTYQLATGEKDPGIPFYSTATAEVKRQGEEIYRGAGCSKCHTLWMVRNMMETVPAPPLDGIGSLRDEQWFFHYFSAPDPQAILPTRLKAEFRMPSYASMPEADRHTLAAYMASLKVQDWYLDQTRQVEYEKLTGKKLEASSNETSNKK